MNTLAVDRAFQLISTYCLLHTAVWGPGVFGVSSGIICSILIYKIRYEIGSYVFLHWAVLKPIGDNWHGWRTRVGPSLRSDRRFAYLCWFQVVAILHDSYSTRCSGTLAESNKVISTLVSAYFLNLPLLVQLCYSTEQSFDCDLTHTKAVISIKSMHIYTKKTYISKNNV